MHRLNWRDTILCIITIIIIFYTFSPIITIIISSFSNKEYIVFPPEGFSLKWYKIAFDNRNFKRGFILSVEIAVLASCISLFLGFLASYAISRYSFKFKDLFGLFCQSPGLIPIIVIAIALLMFFSLLKWKISFITLLIGHILITIPYCFRILLPSLQGVDKSYDEAALILGASKFNIFRKIIFPLLKPAIFSALLFSFVVSFGNLSLSLFLSKPGTSPLTVVLFQKAEYGQDPSLSAISGIFILFSIIGVLVIQKTIGIKTIMK